MMRSYFFGSLVKSGFKKKVHAHFFSTWPTYVNTSIIINAPQQKVWDILTDFSRYPDWNPLLTQVKGHFIVGGYLNVFAKLYGIPVFFSPTIISITPDKEFVWKGNLFHEKIFHGIHRFAVEEVSSKKTKFIHSEQYGSALFKPLFPVVAKISSPCFVKMNEALKHQCEEESNTTHEQLKKLIKK